MNIIEIEGIEAEKLLSNEKINHENEIYKILSKFNSFDLFQKLHNLIHTIEEFINVFNFGLKKDSNLYEFLEKNISMENMFLNFEYENTWNVIEEIYGKETKLKLIKLVSYTTAQNISFKICGLNLGEGIHLDTIGGMVNYYQSRRRYFNVILYLIPSIKSGDEILDVTEILNEILAIVELQSIPITSVSIYQVLLNLNKDFKILSDGKTLTSNYNYNKLDEMYMEPERISLIEQFIHREEQIKYSPSIKIDKNKIFSVNELKDSISLIETSYDFFTLNNSKWCIYKEIILKLLEYTKEDYFISIKINQFNKIIKSIVKENFTESFNELIFESKSYLECIEAYHPLIKFHSRYYTSVNLLMRFLYHYKNIILNKSKKFQIHSGFVFEDQLKKKLEEYNFTITDIKRINRKEFDVVTVKNNVIYNFQCKNSFIDISLINTNQKQFIRHNKRLVNYFKKSIIKEEKREKLLKDKLKINKIEHFVVSRFPIMSENKRIISFRNIDDWLIKNTSNKDLYNAPL